MNIKLVHTEKIQQLYLNQMSGKKHIKYLPHCSADNKG